MRTVDNSRTATVVRGRTPRRRMPEWRRVLLFASVHRIRAFKLLLLGAQNWRIRDLDIPHSIQSREYSRDGGADGFSHNRGERERQPQRPVWQSERQAVGRELELARQQLQPERSGGRVQKLAIALRAPMFGGMDVLRKLPHPSAEHPADLVELFRERDIFLVIERLDFPKDLQEEFHEIKICRRFSEIKELLLFAQVSGNEDRFGGFNEKGVDLRAERVARIFGDVRQVAVPEFICRDEVRYDREGGREGSVGGIKVGIFHEDNVQRKTLRYCLF